tara:strand:+ start:1026 stop:1205 length:180 start_codon:yes stop_codon:yes gene_type:complete
MGSKIRGNKRGSAMDGGGNTGGGNDQVENWGCCCPPGCWTRAWTCCRKWLPWNIGKGWQ